MNNNNNIMNVPADKSEFSSNDLVFAKVRGHPYWPGMVKSVSKISGKNTVKYEIEFFETKQINTVFKSQICSYKDNRLNFPVDSVALKYQDTYKLALIQIEKMWECENKSNKIKSSPYLRQKSISTENSILEST